MSESPKLGINGYYFVQVLTIHLLSVVCLVKQSIKCIQMAVEFNAQPLSK